MSEVPPTQRTLESQVRLELVKYLKAYRRPRSTARGVAKIFVIIGAIGISLTGAGAVVGIPILVMLRGRDRARKTELKAVTEQIGRFGQPFFVQPVQINVRVGDNKPAPALVFGSPSLGFDMDNLPLLGDILTSFGDESDTAVGRAMRGIIGNQRYIEGKRDVIPPEVCDGGEFFAYHAIIEPSELLAPYDELAFVPFVTWESEPGRHRLFQIPRDVFLNAAARVGDERATAFDDPGYRHALMMLMMSFSREPKLHLLPDEAVEWALAGNWHRGLDAQVSKASKKRPDLVAQSITDPRFEVSYPIGDGSKSRRPAELLLEHVGEGVTDEGGEVLKRLTQHSERRMRTSALRACVRARVDVAAGRIAEELLSGAEDSSGSELQRELHRTKDATHGSAEWRRTVATALAQRFYESRNVAEILLAIDRDYGLEFLRAVPHDHPRKAEARCALHDHGELTPRAEIHDEIEAKMKGSRDGRNDETVHSLLNLLAYHRDPRDEAFLLDFPRTEDFEMPGSVSSAVLRYYGMTDPLQVLLDRLNDVGYENLAEEERAVFELLDFFGYIALDGLSLTMWNESQREQPRWYRTHEDLLRIGAATHAEILAQAINTVQTLSHVSPEERDEKLAPLEDRWRSLGSPYHEVGEFIIANHQCFAASAR